MDTYTDLVDAIAEAASNVQLTDMSAWIELDALSTHTSVDDVEVDRNGVVLMDDGSFNGVANVYVSLQYGKDTEEGFISSESFLAEFSGYVEDGSPVIQDMTVNTAGFYDDDSIDKSESS